MGELGSLGCMDLAPAAAIQLEEWKMDILLLDSEWAQLSSGEAQRVWLSIGLASKPAVLLLDEPTSALDEASKQLVETSVLRFIRDGGAAIVVTHDRAQAQRLGDVWEVEDVPEDAIKLSVNEPDEGLHVPKSDGGASPNSIPITPASLN